MRLMRTVELCGGCESFEKNNQLLKEYVINDYEKNVFNCRILWMPARNGQLSQQFWHFMDSLECDTQLGSILDLKVIPTS